MRGDELGVEFWGFEIETIELGFKMSGYSPNVSHLRIDKYRELIYLF
jgi:hypothetical protein